MLVADTAYFIALFRHQDQYHEQAAALHRDVEQNNHTLLVTSHVFDETVTYIFKKDGSEKAYQIAQVLFDSLNISIENVTRSDLKAAAEILRKYKKLSISDSLNVHAARKHAIHQILSFDSGYDHVEGITRLG